MKEFIIKTFKGVIVPFCLACGVVGFFCWILMLASHFNGFY